MVTTLCSKRVSASKKFISFPQFCPSIFLSLSVALSLDYTLFMISRFREEIKKGTEPLDALWLTVLSGLFNIQ